MGKDEALKLALEALEWIAQQHTGGMIQRKAMEPLLAIKEALAQPAQEAVKERKNNKEWKAFDRWTRKQLKEYVNKVLQEKNMSKVLKEKNNGT